MMFVLTWMIRKFKDRKELEPVRMFWFGEETTHASSKGKWIWCRRALVISWGCFIGMVWGCVLAAHTGYMALDAFAGLIHTVGLLLVLGNVAPACLALWDTRTRQNLRREPTALMFVVLIGSLGGALGLVGVMGVSWSHAVNGLLIGLSMYVLSFGVAFPLGLALMAALWTWSTVRREGEVSSRYAWGMGVISSAGWILTVSAGVVLAGNGG